MLWHVQMYAVIYIYGTCYFRGQWYNRDTILHIIIFVGSESHVLAASYSAKYFNFVVKTAEISGQMANSIRFVYNKLLAMKMRPCYTATAAI